MQESPSYDHVHLAPTMRVSRRTAVALAAKLACGVALTAMAGARMAQIAAAEGEEIVLTATASEVGARPGSAYAQGNAALASADQDDGAATVPASGAGTAIPDGGTGAAADTPMTDVAMVAKHKCNSC